MKVAIKIVIILLALTFLNIGIINANGNDSVTKSNSIQDLNASNQLSESESDAFLHLQNDDEGTNLTVQDESLQINSMNSSSFVNSANLSVSELNPDFIEYMERQQSNVKSMAVDDERLNGVIPCPVDFSYLNPINFTYSVASYTSSYDLREQGKVTSVKNQGSCGSCWSFATYGSLESTLMPEENFDLSEQNLKNLHGFNKDGCNGGTHLMSTAYLARWDGPVLEADDPYNPDNSSSPSLDPVKHINKVLFLPLRQSSLDNDAIKIALQQYGAVYVDMAMFDEAYNSSFYSYYYEGSSIYDGHAVTIVGWDDNYDRNNFSTPAPGNGAFIVKNSWGDYWGDDGYFYVSYYDTMFGRRTGCAVFIAEDATRLDNIYQYDPLGYTTFSLGYGSGTAWGSNVFTANSNETLEAVSFYALQSQTSYEVYIYADPDSNPYGDLKTSMTGSVVYPGYYTVNLNQNLTLSEGQKFSVVIKFNTPDYYYPLAVESPYGSYSDAATANAKESYFSQDGSNWVDLTDVYSNANLCIKAFTTDMNKAPSATILSLSPNPADEEDMVFFEGTGNDTDGEVTGYNWESNIDGHLSSSANFSTSNLSAGYHKISFKVLDNDGTWSDEVTTFLMINRIHPVNITLQSHIGGVIRDTVVAGDYAYAGQGQNLIILDVSNTSQPVEMGKLLTPSKVLDIEIAGNYAYVANGESGLIIVDVGNPDKPEIAGIYSSGTSAEIVAVFGNYSYVFHPSHGISIVNISNPAIPTLEGSYSTSGSLCDVEIAGNHLYVADEDNGLLILNVSSPAAPVLEGSYSTSALLDVEIAGNYVYMADMSDCISIVNISNPALPVLENVYNDGNCWPEKLVVSGNYAYVSDWLTGLLILDISDPAAPAIAGTYQTDGSAIDVEVSGNSAYISDRSNGLIIINITNKTSPGFSGTYPANPYMIGIDFWNNHTYVVDLFNGLAIYDLSNPTLPLLAGEHETGYLTADVDVSDNCAYVTDVFNGLMIFDISDSESPETTGNCYIDGLPRDIVVSGSYAYVIATDHDLKRLMIIDVSDPASPAVTGTYETESQHILDWWFEDVDVSGNYAYLTDYENGLFVLDISDPASPVIAGSFDTGDLETEVTVSGNYAYVVTNKSDLLVVDISNPASLTLTGSYHIGEDIVDAKASGRFVITTDIFGVISVIDVSNPALPTLAGTYDTIGDEYTDYSIAMAGNQIYLAGGDNGLVALKTDLIFKSNNAPTATISSISPDPADKGDSVFFEGSGSDTDGGVAGYNWISSIDGYLSNSANFSTSGLSAGKHTIYFRVFDDDGEWSENIIYTLEIEGSSSSGVSSSSSTSSSSGGGGGGGGATTGEDFENIKFKDVQGLYAAKDELLEYIFDSQKNPVTHVEYFSLKNTGKVQTIVEVLINTSSFAKSDAPGNIYQQMNIWVGKAGFVNPENVENLSIGFKVEKSWLDENNLDASTVNLYRYESNLWNVLPTTVVSEDETYVYFESPTPGFSPFAICSEAEQKETDEETKLKSVDVANVPEDDTELETDAKVDELEEVAANKNKSTGIFAIGGGIAVLLVGAFVVYRKRS
ncbi:lectin like domain-containing protein [uncultured Methanolobus sp.]|uniref:lectin like domain-containing protein n=1 Tax=uncultured Methanolobus sp. TaxID=218300 RepID=UPI002AAB1F8C|nr:lectin like domain-containing protein [uncultured Methanolobus sp.]